MLDTANREFIGTQRGPLVGTQGPPAVVRPICCGIHKTLIETCEKALRIEFEISEPVAARIASFVEGDPSVFDLYCIMIGVFTDAQCLIYG